MDFIDGIQTISVSGDPRTRHGVAVYVYTCNQDMKDKAFFNTDGDFLIVPQDVSW